MDTIAVAGAARTRPFGARISSRPICTACTAARASSCSTRGFPTREYSAHCIDIHLLSRIGAAPAHCLINCLTSYFCRYTFSMERIKGELVGDDQFALPFWNWGDQSADVDGHTFQFLPNVVPRFYRQPDKYPALFRHKRDSKLAPAHPDFILDISQPAAANPLSDGDEEAVRRANKELFQRYVLEMTWDTPAWLLPGDQPRRSFVSQPMRAGEPLLLARKDAFEYKVHGAVHAWIGDQASGMEDFGQVYSSVLDPIFGAHHTNVDRIWAVWQSLGGQDYDDPDFLEAAFFFCSEHSELVRVTVADCLDHRKLSLDWQHVDVSWLSGIRTPSPSLATS